MRVWACLNQKGGSGKTTIAVNLAACLTETGHAVLLLDLDPQRSADSWAQQAPADAPFPFTVEAVKLEGARKLKSRLDSVAKLTGAAFVVVDCPPELREESMTAAMLAELVLIPASPSALDLWAARRAVDLCRDARELLGGNRPGIVLIPSKVVPGTVLARQIEAALADFGEPVSPAIAERVAHREASIAGKTIVGYAPHSAAHREFQALTEFLFQEILKS